MDHIKLGEIRLEERTLLVFLDIDSSISIVRN